MQVTDEMVEAAALVMRQRASGAPEQNPEKVVVREMLQAAAEIWWGGIVAAAGTHSDETRRLPAS